MYETYKYENYIFAVEYIEITQISQYPYKPNVNNVYILLYNAICIYIMCWYMYFVIPYTFSFVFPLVTTTTTVYTYMQYI